MTKAFMRAVHRGVRASLHRVRSRTVEVNGERFVRSKEGDFLYLEHPKWSLVGYGRNLEEARRHLLSEAKELAEVMAEMPEDTLAPETLRMRDFVLGVR